MNDQPLLPHTYGRARLWAPSAMPHTPPRGWKLTCTGTARLRADTAWHAEHGAKPGRGVQLAHCTLHGPASPCTALLSHSTTRRDAGCTRHRAVARLRTLRASRRVALPRAAPCFRSAQARAYDNRAYCWNIEIPYKRAYALSSYALTCLALSAVRPRCQFRTAPFSSALHKSRRRSEPRLLTL